jgi:energy-coupling factor transporter transmembrane protein EcfT
MSEEVYQAMVSRGYFGNVRTLSVSRMKAVDVAWMLGCLVAVAVVIWVDRVLGR